MSIFSAVISWSTGSGVGEVLPFVLIPPVSPRVQIFCLEALYSRFTYSRSYCFHQCYVCICVSAFTVYCLMPRCIYSDYQISKVSSESMPCASKFGRDFGKISRYHQQCESSIVCLHNLLRSVFLYIQTATDYQCTCKCTQSGVYT